MSSIYYYTLGSRCDVLCLITIVTSHVSFKESEKDAAVMATTCENCGHFFKFRAQAPFKATVSFTVNGKSVTGK